MVSQNTPSNNGGRPESLSGPEKLALRCAFRAWVERRAAKHGVSHMTIRRALANQKKEAPGSDQQPGQ